MIFRFYSESKEEKNTLLQSKFYSSLLEEMPEENIIGEDIYGNILLEEDDSVKIINHEDLSITETYLNQNELIKTIQKDGFVWIDCYSKIDAEIIKKFENIIQKDEVLHWIQPLFLGGTKSFENITKMNRLKHWEGHLSLIEQLDGTKNGDHIIIKKDG